MNYNIKNVWEDSSVEKWQTLVDPLKVCKKGSRVLLTTQMQSVVDMASAAIGTAAEYLKLDDLDEYDSLMLLKSRLPSQCISDIHRILNDSVNMKPHLNSEQKSFATTEY